MKTIIRVRKNHNADPFARIDKVPLNDSFLSYKAKGILSYVLSKPDGWQVNITDLANHAADGPKAIRSGIKELIKYKYCQRCKVVDPKTKRIIKWVLIFYERPYKSSLKEIVTIDKKPDTHKGNLVKDKKPDPHKGNLDTEPDPRFPHLEKPHLEKPHLENGTLLTNDLSNKRDKDILTKDNNNNKPQDPAAPGNAVVVVPKDLKTQINKLKKDLEIIGWVGSDNEVVVKFIEDPDFIDAWLKKTKTLKGLQNPAGFFRRGIRTNTKPKDIKANTDYLDDPFAEFIE